jgi:cell division protein FtsW
MMKKKRSDRDTFNLRIPLIIFVSTLLMAGLVMLYSTTSSVNGLKTVFNQLTYILIGIIAAFTIRKIDYRRIGFYSLGILVLVMIPLGYLAAARYLLDENIVSSMPFTKMIKGACRWIKLPFFNIQPSEFAKIAIILYLSYFYEKHQRHILSLSAPSKWLKLPIIKPLSAFCRIVVKPVRPFLNAICRPFKPLFLFTLKLIPPKVVMVSFLLTGITTALIFAGKNLSVTVVCGMLIILMSFFAGVRLRYFLAVIIAALSIAAVDFYILEPDQRIIFKEYRMKRLSSFTNPEKVKDEEGYQLWRSQLALGSGGVAGQGFTNSILKNEYIPEAHTDFILAIIGEELGFVALLILLFTFLGLVTIGFMISARARDYMGAYLAAGVSTSILLHTLVNYSVMCGLFPTTGLTLPFISYGGSSMLANLIGIGFLLSVEKHSNEKKIGQKK